MPRPPKLDELDELSFVINYFVAGCRPPVHLIVEFSREPAKSAFLLLFTPSLPDILKSWMRPGTPRRRKPARHGRKRPRFSLNVDPNDWMGNKARQLAPAYPGVDLPGARMLFRLHDQWENIAWTGAVISGLSDIGFETLHGIVTNHPEHCPNYAFVNRHTNPNYDIIGILAPTVPINWHNLDNAQNWPVNGPFVFAGFDRPFTITAHAVILATSLQGTDNFRLQIRDDDDKVLGESNSWSGNEGDVINLAVSAEVEPGRFVYISRQTDFGSVRLLEANMFAFQGTWL